LWIRVRGGARRHPGANEPPRQMTKDRMRAGHYPATRFA
jgi:hypothetical protein